MYPSGIWGVHAKSKKAARLGGSYVVLMSAGGGGAVARLRIFLHLGDAVREAGIDAKSHGIQT
jgi:hypothetical protein